jgi:hypothetical protein
VFVIHEVAAVRAAIQGRATQRYNRFNLRSAKMSEVIGGLLANL